MICAFGCSKTVLLWWKKWLWVLSEVPKPMLWFWCQIVRLSWTQKEFWSVLVLAAVHTGTSRSFDKMMIVCEWRFSDLSWFNGKHSCGKFIIPCLMCDAFLILFLAKQMPACAWACLSVSHSPNGCSPGGIIAKSPPLHTQTSGVSHKHAHTFRSSDLVPLPPHPSLPVGEVEQQGAQRRWRLQERKADQRGNSFTGAKCNVVKWDQPAYLTNPTFHSSSVTRSLIHSVTHLLALRSLTWSLNSNTNKQFSKSRWFSEGDPVCKTKLTWVGYKCINQSFDDVEQLAKVEGCKHHPSGISALPVRSIYEHIRWS